MKIVSRINDDDITRVALHLTKLMIGSNIKLNETQELHFIIESVKIIYTNNDHI